MTLPFKSYLKKKAAYKGGKSRSEVQVGGQAIYKLSSNENPLGASPKAVDAIRRKLIDLAEYPDRTDEGLRKALADFYNNQLSANQFFTANSGLDIIELIVQGFMEEGSECIYSTPAFGAYKSCPKKVGAASINVPLIGENFELDVQGILEAITEKTRIVFITSPNNPTGTHIPKKQMDELVTTLPKRILLVYDEVYFQYVAADDYVRAYHYVQSGKNVIGLNSFSKAYGLAGMRIGYAYSTPEVAEYLHGIRRPFMLSSLSIEAAAAALEDTVFIQQTVKLVQEEKQFLYDRLDLLDIKYWKTQANFILIEPNMESGIFENLMLKEGIMVRVADKFGSPGIRVTIGTHLQNEAFVRALQKTINQ